MAGTLRPPHPVQGRGADRVPVPTELPSSPSEYAAAAVQTVLGQVLQGAQLLPRDSQVPTLARVTTAFVEAWLDHILARKIKFR